MYPRGRARKHQDSEKRRVQLEDSRVKPAMPSMISPCRREGCVRVHSIVLAAPESVGCTDDTRTGHGPVGIELKNAFNLESLPLVDPAAFFQTYLSTHVSNGNVHDIILLLFFDCIYFSCRPKKKK